MLYQYNIKQILKLKYLACVNKLPERRKYNKAMSNKNQLLKA